MIRNVRVSLVLGAAPPSPPLSLRRVQRRHARAPPRCPSPRAVAVHAVDAVESQPIDRFLRVTGSLDGRRAGRSQRRNRRAA